MNQSHKVIDESDAIELAAAVMGQDTWADNFDEDEMIVAFEETYGMDMDTFAKLATRLAYFTVSLPTVITGKRYKGFVDPERSSFIAKIEDEET